MIVDPPSHELPHLPKIPFDPKKLGELPVLPPAPKPDRRIRLSLLAKQVPTVVRIPTKNKIAFVTIDDGGYQPPEAPRLFKAARIPSTQFLIYGSVNRKQAYFRNLQSLGSTIQNHTMSHKKLPPLNRDQQWYEICAANEKLRPFAGHRPTLFRPPYGEYNAITLEVLRKCGGFRANVLWEGSMYNGRMIIKNKLNDGPDDRLQPGMIILMHFTKNFELDFRNLLNRLKKDGYSVGRLEDYIVR